MSAATNLEMPKTRGWLSRTFAWLWIICVATVLSFTALTSLVTLGWLMRRMRAKAFQRAGLAFEHPGWLMGGSASTGVSRILGGIFANVWEGVSATISLFIATAPFTFLWLLSWWAGWENSFSKGYEQAFVGPLLGLFGVVLFCLIMVWLPMALAHQAVENRFLAIFDLARVRSAVRHSGWGYLCLAIVTVIAGLPYFASRGLVTLVWAEIEPLTSDQIEALRLAILIATSAYIVIALIILRVWAARIYAASVARALEGPDAEIWATSPLRAGRRGGRRSWALTHWLRVIVLALIWFGLVAQIFVAQFLNHDWYLWLNHPFIALPWIR